jgi:hypothetical protein
MPRPLWPQLVANRMRRIVLLCRQPRAPSFPNAGDECPTTQRHQHDRQCDQRRLREQSRTARSWGYDARFWEIKPKSGSHVTHRWRDRDSNPRSPAFETAIFASAALPVPPARPTRFCEGDRRFESASLHRRVTPLEIRATAAGSVRPPFGDRGMGAGAVVCQDP